MHGRWPGAAHDQLRRRLKYAPHSFNFDCIQSNEVELVESPFADSACFGRIWSHAGKEGQVLDVSDPSLARAEPCLSCQVVSNGFNSWLVSELVGVAQVEVLNVADELVPFWRP